MEKEAPTEPPPLGSHPSAKPLSFTVSTTNNRLAPIPFTLTLESQDGPHNNELKPTSTLDPLSLLQAEVEHSLYPLPGFITSNVSDTHAKSTESAIGIDKSPREQATFSPSEKVPASASTFDLGENSTPIPSQTESQITSTPSDATRPSQSVNTHTSNSSTDLAATPSDAGSHLPPPSADLFSLIADDLQFTNYKLSPTGSSSLKQSKIPLLPISAPSDPTSATALTPTTESIASSSNTAMRGQKSMSEASSVPATAESESVATNDSTTSTPRSTGSRTSRTSTSKSTASKRTHAKKASTKLPKKGTRSSPAQPGLESDDDEEFEDEVAVEAPKSTKKASSKATKAKKATAAAKKSGATSKSNTSSASDAETVILIEDPEQPITESIAASNASNASTPLPTSSPENILMLPTDIGASISSGEAPSTQPLEVPPSTLVPASTLSSDASVTTTASNTLNTSVPGTDPSAMEVDFHPPPVAPSPSHILDPVIQHEILSPNSDKDASDPLKAQEVSSQPASTTTVAPTPIITASDSSSSSTAAKTSVTSKSPSKPSKKSLPPLSAPKSAAIPSNRKKLPKSMPALNLQEFYSKLTIVEDDNLETESMLRKAHEATMKLTPTKSRVLYRIIDDGKEEINLPKHEKVFRASRLNDWTEEPLSDPLLFQLPPEIPRPAAAPIHPPALFDYEYTAPHVIVQFPRENGSYGTPGSYTGSAASAHKVTEESSFNVIVRPSLIPLKSILKQSKSNVKAIAIEDLTGTEKEELISEADSKEGDPSAAATSSAVSRRVRFGQVSMSYTSETSWATAKAMVKKEEDYYDMYKVLLDTQLAQLQAYYAQEKTLELCDTRADPKSITELLNFNLAHFNLSNVDDKTASAIIQKQIPQGDAKNANPDADETVESRSVQDSWLALFAHFYAVSLGPYWTIESVIRAQFLRCLTIYTVNPDLAKSNRLPKVRRPRLFPSNIRDWTEAVRYVQKLLFGRGGLSITLEQDSKKFNKWSKVTPVPVPMRRPNIIEETSKTSHTAKSASSASKKVETSIVTSNQPSNPPTTTAKAPKAPKSSKKMSAKVTSSQAPIPSSKLTASVNVPTINLSPSLLPPSESPRRKVTSAERSTEDEDEETPKSKRKANASPLSKATATPTATPSSSSSTNSITSTLQSESAPTAKKSARTPKITKATSAKPSQAKKASIPILPATSITSQPPSLTLPAMVAGTPLMSPPNLGSLAVPILSPFTASNSLHEAVHLLYASKASLDIVLTQLEHVSRQLEMRIGNSFARIAMPQSAVTMGNFSLNTNIRNSLTSHGLEHWIHTLNPLSCSAATSLFSPQFNPSFNPPFSNSSYYSAPMPAYAPSTKSGADVATSVSTEDESNLKRSNSAKRNYASITSHTPLDSPQNSGLVDDNASSSNIESLPFSSNEQSASVPSALDDEIAPQAKKIVTLESHPTDFSAIISAATSLATRIYRQNLGLSCLMNYAMESATLRYRVDHAIWTDAGPNFNAVFDPQDWNAISDRIAIFDHMSKVLAFSMVKRFKEHYSMDINTFRTINPLQDEGVTNYLQFGFGFPVMESDFIAVKALKDIIGILYTNEKMQLALEDTIKATPLLSNPSLTSTQAKDILVSLIPFLVSKSALHTEFHPNDSM